jgi:nitrogenase delta subunit
MTSLRLNLKLMRLFEETEMEMKEKIATLENYIMQRCLWQFHSRAWDRENQNNGILGITKTMLLGEEPDLSTPELKCYWVDAKFLVDGFKTKFPWVNDMSKEDIAVMMDGLKERIDYVTIHGSLNEELTVKLY